MKVLWFCNTPANAIFYLKKDNLNGGWMQALDSALQDKVDLHIAFLNPQGPTSFRHGLSTYHSIMPSGWKTRLLMKSFFLINTDRCFDVDVYLEIIEKVKPDIIHIFGSESDFIKIANQTKIPIILSLQGILSSIVNKYYGGFLESEVKRIFYVPKLSFTSFLLKSIISKKKDIVRASKREKEFMSFIKYVDGRTDWDRRVASVLTNNAQYFHIDRILRKSFYENRWNKPNDDQLRLHTTTNSNLFKGFEVLCETIYEVRKKIKNVTCVVAGIHSKDPIVNLTRKRMGARFPENELILKGKLNENSLIQLMLNSHLYITTSYIENSPNNLAEALLLGMPTIATFAGGTCTYIKDNVSGLLVQEGDPLAFAGAILELWGNMDKAVRLGNQAHVNASRIHRIDNVVQQTLLAYGTIYRSNY